MRKAGILLSILALLSFSNCQMLCDMALDAVLGDDDDDEDEEECAIPPGRVFNDDNFRRLQRWPVPGAHFSEMPDPRKFRYHPARIHEKLEKRSGKTPN